LDAAWVYVAVLATLETGTVTLNGASVAPTAAACGSAWPPPGRLTARLPLPVRLQVPERRLSGPVDASVYFFCAEALTNVVKHARACSAWGGRGRRR